MSEEQVCECLKAGMCTRRGRTVSPSLWKLCQSGQCDRVDTVLVQLDETRKERREEGTVKPAKQRKARLREPVGRCLATRIEGLIGIKAGSGCNCKDLSQKMDAWGVKGCNIHRGEIIDALVKNRGILEAALSDRSWLLGAAAKMAPDAMLRAGANHLLDQAIEDARGQMPAKTLKGCKTKLRSSHTTPRKRGERYLKKLKEEQDRLYALTLSQPKPKPDPFTAEPVLHFGAHIWPVKGNWQWHIDLWNQQARLVNGKCFVGIATSPETDLFETVRAALHPSIVCKEFINTSEGENHTFRWLQEVVPQGHNDILIYCHGKGVRYHTGASPAVRRWSEAMYQTVVFNHDMIREKLAAGYKNVHSFRTFGTRPLSPVNRWHPSGTFFAVRAKYLSGRPVKTRYGGVEAWLGDHFKASDSWCEFYDNSMFTTLYDHKDSMEIVEPRLIEWNRVQRYETMCSTWGRNFCRQLPEGSIKGKRVIEVGAVDINGSCRPWIVQQLPASYVGTDMQDGPNVDVICTGQELPDKVGRESQDLIICTEVLEHVEDWYGFLQSIWSVLVPGGILLLTTRSPGFPLHNYPDDFWRFTLQDMLTIFADQDLLTVTADPTSDPGVGVIVRKKFEGVYRVQVFAMK